MLQEPGNQAEHARYERLCRFLARVDFRMRRSWRGRTGSKAGSADTDSVKNTARTLALSGMTIDPRCLLGAARGAFMISVASTASVASIAFLLWGSQFAIVQAFALAVVPFAAREAVLSYPSGVARKRAERITKGAPEAANLMIMSLRHEPSISRAIRFASERGNEFSRELKQCVWDVVMGKHASFEDSLQSLGSRWEPYDPDLKASLHAMVTASCEATEDGKRRALDRANNAIITGAKRRIEAYALSLSTPSMVIFGLGILLPLMIGSFLPMMSWSIWSPGELAAGESIGGDGNLVETVFLMNVLFPCVALVVALGAVSRHPLDAASADHKAAPCARELFATGLVAFIATACSLYLLDGAQRMVAMLLSLTFPWAAALTVWGRRSRRPNDSRPRGEPMEDAMFKTGARMIEGANFEAALLQAGADADGEAAGVLRRLSLRSGVAGQGFDEAFSEESKTRRDLNALEGIRVVHEAAAKNEITAGVLAMDLAAYLKDLRDLESTLKNRLKPTISMMKITAFALGPVVMGVTFAIYLTLMSMAPGRASGLDDELFFLVLGAFLAETNGVVSYFVWGIEGRRDVGQLMESVGICIVVSELVYMATALVAG